MSCDGGHLGFPIVCKLFTFQASSPKPLGQLEPNLAGMFLGWFSTKAGGHLGFSIGPKSNNTWLAACNDHS
jgi:hypothetical protein